MNEVAMMLPKSSLASLCLLCLLAANSWLPAADAPAKPAPKSREQLEQELSKTLSGCQLVGEFTVDGQPRTGDPKTEKYVITSAKKLNGDMWLLTSRMQYGKQDITLPLTLPIIWAGDTPVISLTDTTIIGLGTFTCRVMIYDGRYVGTWQHGKVGGAMFGRIERLPDEPKKATDKNPDKEQTPKSEQKTGPAKSL